VELEKLQLNERESSKEDSEKKDGRWKPAHAVVKRKNAQLTVAAEKGKEFCPLRWLHREWMVVILAAQLAAR
jgi:hypothetical protein